MTISVRTVVLILVYGGLVIGLTGCFKNPGQEQIPISSSAIPIDPMYNTDTNSSLYAHGSCGGLTSIIFTYSSALTSQNTVTAQCQNDKIATNLPVQSGLKQQTFKVTIVGQLMNRKAPPITVTVNWLPPPQLTPGYAVLSGGGKQTGTFTVINEASIGEVVTPPTTTATGLAVLRTGVQGVNDP